jgi:hypothetical protein
LPGQRFRLPQPTLPPTMSSVGAPSAQLNAAWAVVAMRVALGALFLVIVAVVAALLYLGLGRL